MKVRSGVGKQLWIFADCTVNGIWGMMKISVTSQLIKVKKIHNRSEFTIDNS